jgi:hypothetical protein
MNECVILQKDFDRLCILKHKTDEFTAEASDLDFPVGQWPAYIKTDVGNSQPLVLSTLEYISDELQYCLYRQHLGTVTMKIFND